MPNVVVVDDRVTNRNILAKLAATVEEGLNVRAFASPREALAYAHPQTPDLVITDYQMPDMDGAAFIRRFRQLPACEDVPVVVVTVYEDRNYCYQALEAGATDFLLSPFDHVEFRARARNLLTLRRQQKQLECRTAALHRALISNAEQHQADIRESEDRLRRVLDTVPATITTVDAQGRVTLLNAYHAELLGVDAEWAIGRSVAEVFGDAVATRFRVLDRKVFETAQPVAGFEHEVLSRDGQASVVLTTKAPLLDASGRVVDVITVSLDITEHKRVEAEMRQRAQFDGLTGLPNRSLFRDRLEQELARARRDGTSVALHLLDLDRFKGINDSFAHSSGDHLLKLVAGRLRAALPETDTVARVGGDEFAILQTNLRRPDGAAEAAGRLLEAFSTPFLIEGQEIHCSASVGITVAPGDGDQADQLLRNVDVAMYRAKASGRNVVRFFGAAMDRTARRTLMLERELRQALAADQFTVYYQPQLNLRSGEITGVEALLRWNHPERGLLPAAEFIDVAEDVGLITPLSNVVMRQASRDHAFWSRCGAPGLRLAINLSPAQFRDRGVEPLVAAVLAETGLDPSYLDFELTESIAMHTDEVTLASLQRLHELGIIFSLDDFGTGYSSLAYLRRLPVDRLKIDRGFVQRLGQTSHDDAIVRAIIDLGRSLGQVVIAEGVETEMQLEHLRRLRCDEAQGELIGVPMPAKMIAAAVLARRAAPSLPQVEA